MKKFQLQSAETSEVLKKTGYTCLFRFIQMRFFLSIIYKQW